MDSVRYIFDAKYYQNLKSLDYKQVSYYFLLKHAEATRDSENNVVSNIQTYNALFLPTELDEHSEVHFELDSFYNVDEAEFVNGHGTDPQLTQGADHAAGNLAAVSDQDSIKRGGVN